MTEADLVQVLYRGLHPRYGYEVIVLMVLEREGWYRSLPIDSGSVVNELTRYLEEGWTPVISSDVDGENSLPLRLDRD